MAKQTKKTTSTSTTTTKSKTKITLTMVSFWTLVTAALLYLVAMILSLCGVASKIVMALQNAAMAVMVVIVAILAWRYVFRRPVIYKVLYIIVLLVVIVGIILPLI